MDPDIFFHGAGYRWIAGRAAGIVLLVTVLWIGCASSRTTYQDSLKPYKYDRERLRQTSLYYLASEYSKRSKENSDERRLFEELNELDMQNSADSARTYEIYRIILKDLDPDKLTPAINEFFEPTDKYPKTMLDARMDCIELYRGWHPGNYLLLHDLDDFGKDVLMFGVFELDSSGISTSTIDGYFPEAGPLIERRYARKLATAGVYWEHVPTTKQLQWAANECKEGLPNKKKIAHRIKVKAQGYLFRELAEQSREIYTKVSYDALDDVAAGFVSFPGRGPGSWDGSPGTYGMEPWRWLAGQIDISARLKRLAQKDSTGRRVADVIVEYTLSRVSDNVIVSSDSIRYVKNISGDIDKNDELSVQLVTDWFHTINPPEPPPSSNEDYLLGVSVRNSHDEKTFQENFHISLPNDTLTLPEYTIMFARDSQPERESFPINPYRGIPSFLPTNTIHKGDTIDVWFPITDIPYSPIDNAYCCSVDIYLVEVSSKKGWVTLSDIEAVWDKDAPREYGDDEGPVRKLLKPIRTEIIRSDQPNLYHVLELAVPKKVGKGKYHLVAYFRSLPDSATGEIEVLGGASKKVVIK